MANDENKPLALVVDDDPVMRMLICQLMEQMGLAVIEAEDGEIALSEFMRRRPAIVVTDVRMPNMDGLAASAEMRKIADSTQVPIIVISGVDDRSVVRHAYEVGANTYLNKPVNLAELRHAISEALPAADLCV